MITDISPDIWELLEYEATRINSPSFIGADPVQFPRRFTELQDIEIASLLCATIAWGNRRMICRDCDRMLELMDNQPFRFMMDEGYEELPDRNIHRTFFAKNLRHFLRGLRSIYMSHGSLADFARAEHIDQSETPAWELARLINGCLAEANGGISDSRCLPVNLKSTALKRLNMALRWLVRDDGIVDLGVWKGVIKPSQLYIPMDVHVNNTARELGLLERKAADRRSVLDLTRLLATRRPEDPVWFDYALFGIGVGVPAPETI